jgi:hypothetical protein
MYINWRLTMDAYRLKVKVGNHEFDAEGPSEAVTRQFEAWKEMIASTPIQKNDTPASSTAQEETVKKAEETGLSMDKIFRSEGRVISLTAPPASDEEAALLVLLGQRHYRNNESVTGSEIMDGLSQSGYRLLRVDRMMDRLSTEGTVIRSGMHRGTRYRLSNTGLARAQAIARDVIGRVA